MNEKPELISYEPKPIKSGERPIVAAAIVFSPIIIAVILLICYVLLNK